MFETSETRVEYQHQVMLKTQILERLKVAPAIRGWSGWRDPLKRSLRVSAATHPCLTNLTSTHSHSHGLCPFFSLLCRSSEKMLLLLLGIIFLHVAALVLLFVSTIVSVSKIAYFLSVLNLFSLSFKLIFNIKKQNTFQLYILNKDTIVILLLYLCPLNLNVKYYVLLYLCIAGTRCGCQMNLKLRTCGSTALPLEAATQHQLEVRHPL